MIPKGQEAYRGHLRVDLPGIVSTSRAIKKSVVVPRGGLIRVCMHRLDASKA